MDYLKNPITENYLNLKNKVLYDTEFPWYYNRVSTRDDFYKKEENFPYYAHTVLAKPRGNQQSVINSPYYNDCHTVLKEIFDCNKIQVEYLYRISFNSTFYHDCKYGDPHIDHEFPHKNLIIYLNPQISGNTFIFNERYGHEYSKTYFSHEDHPLTLEHEINSKEDLVFTFDGLKYHTQGFTEPSKRRVILVATYS